MTDRASPEERLARLESDMQSIQDLLTSVHNELKSHTAKDDASFDALRLSVADANKEVLLAISSTREQILTTKADTKEVATIKRYFWLLVGMLVGSGVLTVGAAVQLLGG